MKVVLVTGSRKWRDYDAIAKALLDESPDVVIHGAQVSKTDEHGRELPREEWYGADWLAHRWTMANRITEWTLPAPWHAMGNSAGPARNGAMVALAVHMQKAGHTVRVIAFPTKSSRGTWDCVRQAQAAHLAVLIRRGEP